MKKTNLILPGLSRKSAFKCGVFALALVTMTGCKDDAPGEGGVGSEVLETVEGLDLSVLTNPNLAKTYYNSHLALGSRAGANEVPEFPGMPAIPELTTLNVLDNSFNPYYMPEFNGQANFLVPAGESIRLNSGLVGKGNGIVGDNIPKYYIAGELTIPGTGSDSEMEIHILDGGKLIDESVISPKTTIYIHKGGDILRASQSNEKIIHIEGTLVSEADLVHDDINFEILGECYTTGKIHGKNVTLVGGKVYAGCAVTAEETVYLTGNNSIVSTGYVSAPVIELAGNEPLNIVLRDGGYLLATEQLRLKDVGVGTVVVRAEDGDYAMVETDVLDVNDKNLEGSFYNVAINYNTQIGTQEMGADETSVTLLFNETCKVKEYIDYTVVDGDDCAPKVVEGPKDPTPDPDPDPELENIGSVEPDEHAHPISATSIFTVGKDAYLSWHTQGAGFHGCIEHLTVDNGTVTLNSYLETAPTNDTYGAIDFNHVIYDNGKIFVAGDHPKKGGILGWINCDGGTFPTGNTATLNLITLYKEQYVVNGDTLYSNGGSGNCIIRNGEYYQTASVAGFETFNVADFTEASWKLKSIAKLPSWSFDPSLSEAPANPWERDGSRTGKHIATDGSKVVMLTLINRDNAANTANASIKVFNANDVNYENEVASYVVEDVLLSPVDGKDVIAIEGSDIWVCLGQGGVKHLTLAGNTLTEVASFRLADKSKEELKGWQMSTKEAAAACANGLAVDNNYVYIAHGGAGLIVLKKNDLSYVTRTRYTGGNSANYISLNADGYIYVAYGKSKVQVYAWKK